MEGQKKARRREKDGGNGSFICHSTCTQPYTYTSTLIYYIQCIYMYIHEQSHL